MDKPDYVRAWERATGWPAHSGEGSVTEGMLEHIAYAWRNSWWYQRPSYMAGNVPKLESPEWLAGVLGGLLR